MRSVDQFKITDPTTASSPYAYYAAMRREEPVHLDPGTGAYWVSRYETVARLALDTEALSSKSSLMLRKSFQPRAQALWDAAGMVAIDTLVSGDPPEHGDYRALGMALFNPKKVAEMAPRIAAHVNELIDGFGNRSEVDFIEHFAARLPASLVCDEFGLPREDQPRFKNWTDAMILLHNPDNSEDIEAELVTRAIELFTYLRKHLQASVNDSSGRVIHALATGTRRDGSSFSLLERAWMLLFIFGGSNETTINMLACGVRRLAGDPGLQSRLRDEPALIPAFIDELMRLDGSVQTLMRVATRDLEVDGTVIPKGANVMLCTSSANRDDQRWTDPDAFRLDRNDARRHLSFGQGPHVCIGVHLARRILHTAFETLLKRLDPIELAIPDNEVEQLPLPFHRAMARLPIRLPPMARRF